jgi:hypothetical protein
MPPVTAPALHPVLHGAVAAGLFGLLAYAVVRYGPDGYPISLMLGGLLGAYGGVAGLIRGQKNGADK